ncbi:MAG: histidine phosphatase family protein, partial [Candidatus Omnitrophica bacterium]|nr:histidine phosphatase family protein [Candidatus Omnitrophota bacterium]
MRHAETTWNRENRLQGHSDLPLSPVGEEQARRVGAFFASRHLRQLVTSGLRRTRQTAEAILAGNGHRLIPAVDHELREIHLGVWEGLTPQEIDAQFAGAYQRWKEQPSTVTIPQAEPLEAFQQRVRRAMARVVSQLKEGDHAVVTHGGVIAMILADVLGADYDAILRRLRLDNAGITALEFGQGRPHVLWVNSTVHLD